MPRLLPHLDSVPQWEDKSCGQSQCPLRPQALALQLLCCRPEVKPPDFSHRCGKAWWWTTCSVTLWQHRHNPPRKWCLYPCQRTAALRAVCVFMAEPATFKPKHLLTRLPCLYLSAFVSHCFLVWNNIACLLLLIPEDWTPVSTPLGLLLY